MEQFSWKLLVLLYDAFIHPMHVHIKFQDSGHQVRDYYIKPNNPSLHKSYEHHKLLF